MEALLKQAVEITTKPKPPTENARQYSVVLKMHPRAMVSYPYVKRYILPLMPGAEVYPVAHSGVNVIALYEDSATAIRIESLVNDTLSKYNELLIETLDGDNWLEQYLSYRSLGIEIVMKDGWLTKRSDIEDYLEKSSKSMMETIEYRDSLSNASAAAVDYTHDDIIRDLLNYSENVFDPESYDADHLEAAVRDSLSAMDEALSGRSMLPKYTCQQTLYALNDKLRFKLMQLSKSDIEASVKAYTDTHKIMEDVTGQIKHEDWTACSRIFAKNISEQTPVLRFKQDLSNTGDNQDRGFLTFGKGSYEYDLNTRLSPANIKRSIDGQGRNLRGELSGALAAYYLRILEAKHEEAFEKAIHQYSANINVKTFSDDLSDIIQDTMPNPANPKKATHKPA